MGLTFSSVWNPVTLAVTNGPRLDFLELELPEKHSGIWTAHTAESSLLREPHRHPNFSFQWKFTSSAGTEKPAEVPYYQILLHRVMKEVPKEGDERYVNHPWRGLEYVGGTKTVPM